MKFFCVLTICLVVSVQITASPSTIINQNQPGRYLTLDDYLLKHQVAFLMDRADINQFIMLDYELNGGTDSNGKDFYGYRSLFKNCQKDGESLWRNPLIVVVAALVGGVIGIATVSVIGNR